MYMSVSNYSSYFQHLLFPPEYIRIAENVLTLKDYRKLIWHTSQKQQEINCKN